MTLVSIDSVNIPNRDFYIEDYADIRGWAELIREIIGEAAASLFEHTFQPEDFMDYDQGYADGYAFAKEEFSSQKT